MKLRWGRILLSILSTLTLLPESASASGAEAETEKSSKSLDFADQLMQNHMFLIDNDSNAIILNEEKILELVKSSIDTKIKDQNVSEVDRTQYQKLINNIKPGNFGRSSIDARNLRSMDFEKGL